MVSDHRSARDMQKYSTTGNLAHTHLIHLAPQMRCVGGARGNGEGKGGQWGMGYDGMTLCRVIPHKAGNLRRETAVDKIPGRRRQTG